MDNLKLKPLGAILLLGGILLLWLTLRSGDHGLLQEPQTIEGEVVERYTASTRTQVDPGLFLRIRVTADGTDHVIEREVDEQYWNAHREKTNVTLALHGTDVRKAKVVGASNDDVWFWVKAGGGAVASVLGLVVLGYDRWWR
jgi:hypothetical protein